MVQNPRYTDQQFYIDCCTLEDVIYITTLTVQLTRKPVNRMSLGLLIKFVFYHLPYMQHGILYNPFVLPANVDRVVQKKKKNGSSWFKL